MTIKQVRPKPGFTLVELLVVIAIIAMLVTLLLPAVQSAREAARRAQCLNNLRQMGLGVLNYESARSVFPAGCVLDAPCCNNFKTYTGWTIEILPFMENAALNDLYDPRISIGSPEAKRFRETEVTEYVCPSDEPPRLLQPQSGPEAGWGSDKSRVWMMSSYRGNSGRSNGATTWYLAEDVDQSPLSWRGPLHYVPLPGTEDKFELPLKREALVKIIDGTSKTLLAAEQTNLVAERRSFWAHTFGNYVMSQATDQRRIFMNDYDACRALTGTGGARPCMVAWYAYHAGDGMNYVNCDGSGGFFTFAGNLEVFNARASIAGEETGDTGALMLPTSKPSPRRAGPMLGKHRLAMIQFAMLAVLSMALMGCGRGAQFTVSGTVTLGDKPLADAYVVFEPLIGSPGQVSQGKTDAQGVFTLVSADGHEGALVGPHQVKLTTIPPDAMDDERSPLPRDRVPARYRYEPLEFEVAPEGTDAANFALLNR